MSPPVTTEMEVITLSEEMKTVAKLALWDLNPVVVLAKALKAVGEAAGG